MPRRRIDLVKALAAPRPPGERPALAQPSENRHGKCYTHSPSLLARRVWMYVFSLGSADWPPGCRYGHPVIHPVVGRKSEGFLLHFILRGQLHHSIADRAYVAGPNDAVWMDVGRRVQYRNETANRVRFCWVLFNGRNVPELFEALGADRDPMFRSLDRPGMLSIIQQLRRVVARQSKGCEARISTLLSGLVEQLVAVRPIRTPLGSVRDAPAGVSEPVLHAIAMLSTAYHVAWSVKYLSQKVGLSPSYFIRQFREEVGMTPLHYLNHYRVEQAKALLSGTKLSVTEVAHTVGVPSVERFSKLFHEMAGQSPRRYRLSSSRK